ncbi:hypothetical protein WG904_18455 [Pedobacter sp. Du54]|uniref:hypothetical protein n=1 Tax=Pedobacter anseongensis TaxID=3133439 RepID=UPI0030AFA41B
MKNLSKIKHLANTKLLLFCLLMPINVIACDICGCFMGLTPYDNQSNFGLLYRYRSFSGYKGQKHSIFPRNSDFLIPKDSRNAPLTTHMGNASDYEAYRTLEFRGRYFIHRRIELNAIIPYNSNTERYNSYTSSISGMGDVNLFAGYHLIRKLNGPNVNQRLIVGAGVKLPSGKNNVKTTTGIRYSALMQPGTGSTDGFLYLNYLLGYKKFGLSLNTAYKVNGQNKEAEGIANSSTSFLNFFYTQRLNKNWQIMPSAQFFYEKSAGETYNEIRTGEHEMNNLMAGLGADIYYKNIALNIGIQTNAWQAKTDHPQSAGKIYIGLTYNLNQLYYLL